MRIAITAVGRLKAGPERELASRYIERAAASGRALGLTGFAAIELPESRAARASARRAEEARAIAAAIPEGTVKVVLDERGQSFTSLKLATAIARWRDDARPAATFIIGGADGLDTELMQQADLRIAFSELTWPHQLARIMLAEQLYRVTAILSGHPYHRGG